MTIVEAAIEVLKKNGKPMKTRELWNEIEKQDLFHSEGKTPWLTLASDIIGHSKGIKSSKDYKTKYFYRHGPATYGLLEWINDEEQKLLEEDELVEELIESENVPDASKLDTNLFLEQEWHHWLFKNLENNGLEAIGFGKLKLFDELVQSKDNLGKYNTNVVGEIDLLLKNKSGDLVVVELKRKGVDETVGQICRYVGWVEENLLKGKNKKVYGVIIAQIIDEKLRYAIKPIKDHIFYQQLKMSVEFGESSRKPNPHNK